MKKRAVVLVLLTCMIFTTACGNAGAGESNNLTMNNASAAINNGGGDGESVVENGTNDQQTDNSVTEDSDSHNYGDQSCSVAEFIQSGVTSEVGTSIQNAYGSEAVSLMSPVLEDSYSGIYDSYDLGNIKGMFFTGRNGEVVLEMKGQDVDCTALFSTMAETKDYADSLCFFGTMSGMLNGTNCDGAEILLKIERTDSSGFYISILSNSEFLIEASSFWNSVDNSEDNSAIMAEENWFGTYSYTDGSDNSEVIITVRADDHGLLNADIVSAAYTGTCWGFQKDNDISGIAFQTAAWGLGDEYPFISLNFILNDVTGVCSVLYYSINGVEGYSSGNAFKENDYLAPSTLANKDDTGVWGEIPIHDTDAQYFEPTTKDYIVSYAVGEIDIDVNYTETAIVQQYTLNSYNELGKCVNEKYKYVCPDETAATKMEAHLQDRMQYLMDGRNREITRVGSIVYQYETDSVDAFPFNMYNDKSNLLENMGEYFFYDRHFLEKSDGNATIYYWLSDITSREEGIEKNEVFSKYMKPFAGRYQKENASDGSNSEINLLADSIFITNLNINFLDKEGNIINGGSDFIQCDEDGNLIVISSSYESYYFILDLTFQEDGSSVTGHYYKYALENGCPTFADYQNMEYFEDGDLGVFTYNSEW